MKPNTLSSRLRRCGSLGIAALALVAGCSGKPGVDDGPALLDTGWFSSDSGAVDPENCPDKFVATTPIDGETGWYWRDRPQLYTQSQNQDGYSAWLQTDDGERLATTMVWDPASGLSFTLECDGHLAPNTTYTLGIEDCAESREVTFTTSNLGVPLEEPASSLIGNTYLLDLVGATWVEPSALSAVLQQYFNTPILLGIRYANEDTIRLVGAPGKVDTLGNVTQDTSSPTWDFPLADFTESPFLDVTAPTLSFQYSDGGGDPIEVPVEDFVLTATISADGTTLGGGVLSGLGDSRDLGTELLGGDPGDLCVFAAGLGVSCLPCSDGLPYCLKLVARDLDAVLLPDLVITEPGAR